MTDEEWERWKDTFQRAGKGAPPRVMKRAMTDRRRAMLGMIVFYVLCAASLLVGLARLGKAHGVGGVASFVLGVLILAILGVGAPLAMRGTWSGDGVPVLERLAALERRHAGRRRLIRLVFSAMAIVIVGNVLLFAFDGDRVRLLSSAVSVVFAWLVLRRAERLIDRDLREAEEVRKLLTDVDPSPSDTSGREGKGA